METPKCGICDNPIPSILIPSCGKSTGKYSVAWCETCQAGMTVPHPTDGELSKLYAANHYRLASGRRFNSLIETLITLFRFSRRRRIRKYKETGSILDIGCGRGTFLQLMKNEGWHAEGLEVDKTVAGELSAEYGIEVRSGDLMQADYRASSFDVITITHVLEHVRKPAEVISECFRLLKPGGLLVVSVPNFDSLQAAFGKQSWFHLDLPNHLYHFSKNGLIRLLQQKSFTIDKIKRIDIEYGPFGWLQTLLNRSGISKNAFYELLKKPGLMTNDVNNFTNKDIVFSLLLLPVYVPLSLLLFLLEVLIQKEGVFEIYAVKQ